MFVGFCFGGWEEGCYLASVLYKQIQQFVHNSFDLFY